MDEFISAYTISVDGVSYRLRVKYPSRLRRFQLIEGSNSGTAQSYRKIRDIGGTSYTFTMGIEPDPMHPLDYDAFYEVISAPVESHRVIIPYGQSNIEFDAAIYEGEDTDQGIQSGQRRYTGLLIRFEPMAPQRTVE